MIEMAFVAPDLEEDFRKAKEAEVDDELDITKRKQEELQNGAFCRTCMCNSS